MAPTPARKPTLIVVLNYERNSLLTAFFSDLCKRYQLYFMYYHFPSQVVSQHYARFGEVLFWKDFPDAQTLLERLRPHKVVFFHMNSVHFLALNLAARRSGIDTYYVDHGLRDFDIDTQFENRESLPSLPTRVMRMILSRGLIDKLKDRRFMTRTMSRLDNDDRAFLKKYRIEAMRAKAVIYAQMAMSSPHIHPSAYICFNSRNFEYHRRIHPKITTPVHYIGFPEFDAIARLPEEPFNSRQVLFIDQPFVSFRHPPGWTLEFKRLFIQNLADAMSQIGYELHIKTHPAETNDVWQGLDGRLHFLPDQDFYAQIIRYPVVVGFFSTLLLPLAARYGRALFNLRKHPEPSYKPPTLFTDAGVAHEFDTPEELSRIIGSPNELTEITSKQDSRRAAFIEEWLYKFDGSALKRFEAIIDS